jgi:peptide/nickel transport system substrate-binding protein
MAPRAATLLAALALALALASCGGGGDESKSGGTLKVEAAADFQSIDPGQSYYQFDYMAVFPTQRPLYSWKPDEIEPTPDLATGNPRVSGDGKTVTVQIRDGVRFSPPVNRKVTSHDVKYAIERGATPSVANGYVGTYFGSLQGFKQFQAGKASQISGIETPDDRTIAFRFVRPNGVIAVPQALSLPLTAPVPEEYAQRFDKGARSTYAQHEVATGPYMFQNDGSGKVIGYQPGKRAVLVRNPNWDKSTDYRPAYLGRIQFDLGNDTNVATRSVLKGRHEVSGDFEPPPALIKSTLRSRKDQILFTDSGSNRFIPMNTTIAPLDNVNVRRAIVAGMDRDALRLTQGGAITGDVETHFIPPGVPGFEEAGGLSSQLDFLKNPSGSKEVAAAYFKRAGYRSGRYEGNKKLVMVGAANDPADKLAEAAASQLEGLGFKIDLHLVPESTMYTKFCSVPKAKVAFCPNVGWGRDFNDPQPFLDGAFNGKNIVPVSNYNFPQLDDAKLNAEMDRDEAITDAAKRRDAWAKVDHDLTSLAPAVPILWKKQAAIRSSDVRGVMSRFNVLWDLSFTSLK